MADERGSSGDFCGTTWLPKEFIIALVAAAFSAPFIIKVLALSTSRWT